MVSMGGELLVRRRQTRRVSSDLSSNQVANEVRSPKHVDRPLSSEQRPDPFLRPALNARLQVQHAIHLSPMKVVDEFSRAEIPTGLVDLLKSLDRLRKQEAAS